MVVNSFLIRPAISWGGGIGGVPLGFHNTGLFVPSLKLTANASEDRPTFQMESLHLHFSSIFRGKLAVSDSGSVMAHILLISTKTMKLFWGFMVWGSLMFEYIKGGCGVWNLEYRRNLSMVIVVGLITVNLAIFCIHSWLSKRQNENSAWGFHYG